MPTYVNSARKVLPSTHPYSRGCWSHWSCKLVVFSKKTDEAEEKGPFDVNKRAHQHNVCFLFIAFIHLPTCLSRTLTTLDDLDLIVSTNKKIQKEMISSHDFVFCFSGHAISTNRTWKRPIIIRTTSSLSTRWESPTRWGLCFAERPQTSAYLNSAANDLWMAWH